MRRLRQWLRAWLLGDLEYDVATLRAANAWDPSFVALFRSRDELEAAVREATLAEVRRLVKDRDTEVDQRFADERRFRVNDIRAVAEQRLANVHSRLPDLVRDVIAEEVRTYRLCSVDQATAAASRAVDAGLRRNLTAILEVLGLGDCTLSIHRGPRT